MAFCCILVRRASAAAEAHGVGLEHLVAQGAAHAAPSRLGSGLPKLMHDTPPGASQGAGGLRVVVAALRGHGPDGNEKSAD